MNTPEIVDSSAKIFPQEKIITKDGAVSVGKRLQIGDNACARLAIGRFAHISSFCSIVGGCKCGLWIFVDSVLDAGLPQVLTTFQGAI